MLDHTKSGDDVQGLVDAEEPNQTATGRRGGSGATVRRQSIASTKSASCAGVSMMVPSVIGGQTNFPTSSRL
jgi:hypothetical protein